MSKRGFSKKNLGKAIKYMDKLIIFSPKQRKEIQKSAKLLRKYISKKAWEDFLGPKRGVAYEKKTSKV